MAVFLFLLGCLAVFISVGLFASSDTILHDILAAIIGVAASVFLGCSFIVDAVNKLQKRIREGKPSSESDPDRTVRGA